MSTGLGCVSGMRFSVAEKAEEVAARRCRVSAEVAKSRAKVVGTMPTRMSTINPMPFCPSLEPCAKLTPVQVSTSNPRIHSGGGASPSGARYNAGLRSSARAASSRSAAAAKPSSGEKINALTVSSTFAQLTPSPKALSGLMREFMRPTPTMETDQGVGTGRGQTQIPGAQIPNDGRDEQGENHGETRAGTDVDDQFHRQQRDDAESHGAGRGEHADEVPQTRPDHRLVRLQRMGIDHGRDSVGRIMETIDEFEAQGEQDGEAQQDCGGQVDAEV